MDEKFYSIIDNNFNIYDVHMNYQDVNSVIKEMNAKNPSAESKIAEEF